MSQAGDLEIEIDEDFQLKDEDFLKKPEGIEEASSGDTMEVEVKPEETPESAKEGVAQVTEQADSQLVPRPLAIHLIGVDNLSSDEVEKYVGYYYPRIKYRTQWVDDSSLNMVFDDEEHANDCLDSLTSEAVYYEGTDIAKTAVRPAKSYPFKDGITLTIRQAFETDKKVKGARARSRYYLFNGEPSKEEDQLRFTLNYDEKKNEIDEERLAAKQYRYRMAGDSDSGDLFPNKVPLAGSRPGMSKERRLREVGELFPEKVIASRFKAGLASAGLLATDKNSRVKNNYRERERDLSDVIPGGRNKYGSRSARSALSRDRSKSPDSESSVSAKSNDFADRLDSAWIKGDLLEKRESEERERREGGNGRRRNRRKAADLF